MNSSEFLPNSIIEAIKKGQNSILTSFIENGGNIHLKSAYDNTALYIAVNSFQTSIVRFLLEQNVDPNIADYYGDTPLMKAVDLNSFEMVQLLLQHGADCRMKRWNNQTALSICKYPEIYQIISNAFEPYKNQQEFHHEQIRLKKMKSKNEYQQEILQRLEKEKAQRLANMIVEEVENEAYALKNQENNPETNQTIFLFSENDGSNPIPNLGDALKDAYVDEMTERAIKKAEEEVDEIINSSSNVITSSLDLSSTDKLLREAEEEISLLSIEEDMKNLNKIDQVTEFDNYNEIIEEEIISNTPHDDQGQTVDLPVENNSYQYDNEHGDHIIDPLDLTNENEEESLWF